MRGIFGKTSGARRNAGGDGFLSRLRRDARGNVLAIMAAALIPMCGLVGGGIDISRMYITKTRLQHACDAGALAGRKQMGAGSWGTDDSDAAVKFFDGNYQSGAYGSGTITKAFTENAGKVTGTASTVLPMTLMRVLGKTTETLSVTCDAEMKLPNTDIMFVLDTTGSMNCVAGDTSCTNNGEVPATGSKIDGLKTAVKCFYETLAQLNTNANCTGTPSGGTSSAVQIRFGFMPYASNVNVGHLLPSNFFADSWNYQSRVRSTTTPSDWGDWGTYNYRASTSGGTCSAQSANTASKQYRSTHDYYNGYGWYCTDQSRDMIPNWDYRSVPTSISALKSGTGWNSTFSFPLPINNDGSNRTITWDGCIEERATVQATDYDPIPAGANDLNIDLPPNVGTAGTLWGPALQQLIFYRRVTTSYGQADRSNTTSVSNYYNNGGYSCPTEAKKLQSWPSASAFETYVDSLEARGNTYHDIGMIWGARFMSPTGIFASENALAANGGQIQRHMIFMTDGDATSNPCDYNAYGVPWFDRRQTNDVGDADDCGSNRQKLIDQINLRLEGVCEAVKNRGITLWVVSYGGGLNAATETRLENCASEPDSVALVHKFQATTPQDLQAKFAVIAAAISQLRLTR